MKPIRILLLALPILAIAACSKPQTHSPSIPKDPDIERQIDRILSKMTLDDKVGQMLQLNIDVLGGYTMVNGSPAWALNEEKVDTVIANYRVGSFLNAPGRAATPEQWRDWIGMFNKYSVEHLGVPTLYGLDHNHGVTYSQGGTLFMQPINLGASFNVELAREMAEVTAYESRAGNCPWVFNPVVDLGRDPRWSRIWESFGESPVVNARMVETEVKAYQGDDPNHIDKYHVATSVKHYFAYGAPFTGKDRTPAYLSPQMIREKYFTPFKAAAEAGALTFMVNSASINGMPVHASYEYLTQWLKEDLNWDGMIITDWSDINNLYTREKVAKDKKDAIRIAINAGIDMSMDPYSVDFCGLLKELVEEGAVKMSRIDDAVRRILRVKIRLGLLDTPDVDPADYPLYGSDEFAAKALHAAEEGEVLLKNDGILPLAKNARILLTGPNANQMRCLNGGWSYTWQGSGIEEMAEKYNTIYEAFCNKFGAANVTLEQGVRYNERGSYYDEIVDGFGKAVAAASRADVIVACVGENSYCETPGNLTDLTLSENQRELVKALAKTGKPVILVINGGRPRLVADIEPLASAVVDILLPGNYGADALANLLVGDANFSAKLPYTYPREINSLANYDYKVSEEVGTMGGAYDYDAKVSLQWPFGYGLSYTTFEYSNLKVDRTSFTAGDVLNVSVDVKNTGAVKGKEAVLLYSSDLVASLVPDNRVLRAFDKVELAPGETKTVSFALPASDLAFVGADGKWVLEEGDFILKAGQLTQQVTCSATKKWDTPNILK
ncbi:MAG: glycoside hydrolase family 3 C-terminal domain-containing protein [Bacteroidales bacterium]|nr:glycoside hydrolase family 3 C-terminal domain-containing protein [Bacteroidales bacterium]